MSQCHYVTGSGDRHLVEEAMMVSVLTRLRERGVALDRESLIVIAHDIIRRRPMGQQQFAGLFALPHFCHHANPLPTGLGRGWVYFFAKRNGLGKIRTSTTDRPNSTLADISHPSQCLIPFFVVFFSAP